VICVYSEFREPKPGVGGGRGGASGGRGSDPELSDSWGCGSGRAKAGAELQLVRSRLSRILEESERR
jgi:hypothetical protein